MSIKFKSILLLAILVSIAALSLLFNPQLIKAEVISGTNPTTTINGKLLLPTQGSLDGGIRFGGDVNLYRPANGSVLKTDYDFSSSGKISGLTIEAAEFKAQSWYMGENQYLGGSHACASAGLTDLCWDQGGTGRMWLNGNGVLSINSNGNNALYLTGSPKHDIRLSDGSTIDSINSVVRLNTGLKGFSIKLNNSSTISVPKTNAFVNFETIGLGNVGSIRGNGAKGVQYVTSGTADFAEYLQKDENEKIEFGVLLCIKTDGKVTMCSNDNNNIIGVSSEKPTYLGGDDLGNRSIPVAFLGQVMLKVKGDIKPGDYLTYSDSFGVATKLTNKGITVGRALQSHSGNQVDKIMTLVSPNYYSFDR